MRLAPAIGGVCLGAVVLGAAVSAVGAEKPSAAVKPPWQRIAEAI